MPKRKLQCIGLLSEAYRAHRAAETMRATVIAEGGDIAFQCRQHLGLTQKEMAKRLKVSAVYLCNLESGRATMSLDLASRLCVVVMEKNQ